MASCLARNLSHYRACRGLDQQNPALRFHEVEACEAVDAANAFRQRMHAFKRLVWR